MNLFTDRPYTAEELAEVERIRSRINVAQALLDARRAKGYTQMDLARASGTTQARISQVESMASNPTLDLLDRVAREVGLMVTLTPRHPPTPEADRAE